MGIISEKIKREKWEDKDWFLYLIESFPKFHQKRVKRKLLIYHVKLIIGEDNFSFGDFSFNYDDIMRVEIWKQFFIVIQYKDGKNYQIVISEKLPKKAVKAANSVFSILSEKVEQCKRIRISKGIEFIKNLPKLYKEINLDELSSRVGLERSETVNLIESLILNGELKAEIRGNILKLKKEPEAVASPRGYTSETSPIQWSENREGMLVFLSYATKDAELYKIPELARRLEDYKEIGEVLYWQEDMHDSIIEYMNDNLGRCNGVLLFCSPSALDSIPVKKEWMAAEALKKPIIPIFIKPEHIPPLLSDRLGLEFDTFDFQKNVREIYELLLKKKQN